MLCELPQFNSSWGATHGAELRASFASYVVNASSTAAIGGGPSVSWEI